MRIFIAGGVSGNLKSAWTRAARHDPTPRGFMEALASENFWQGGETRHWVHEASPIKENESIFSGDNVRKSVKSNSFTMGGGIPSNILLNHRPYILESFYYADEDTERLIPLFGDFLLDSGAFTFMQNSKKAVDWDDYIKRYAAFIVRNDVKKFFELDIDPIVGYKKVLQYRNKLESLTGRKCIPVWHKSRGITEFKKMCDEYSYAAIGGIVSGEIKKEQYKAFLPMNVEAHRRGCKVHGLGFTSLDWLPKCGFDSVDSTAWTTGNRFGFVYFFNGKTMKKIDCPKGKRLGDSRKVALMNYTEWLKFQKWAEDNL